MGKGRGIRHGGEGMRKGRGWGGEGDHWKPAMDPIRKLEQQETDERKCTVCTEAKYLTTVAPATPELGRLWDSPQSVPNSDGSQDDSPKSVPNSRRSPLRFAAVRTRL